MFSDNDDDDDDYIYAPECLAYHEKLEKGFDKLADYIYDVKDNLKSQQFIDLLNKIMSMRNCIRQNRYSGCLHIRLAIQSELPSLMNVVWDTKEKLLPNQYDELMKQISDLKNLFCSPKVSQETHLLAAKLKRKTVFVVANVNSDNSQPLEYLRE